MGYSNTKKLPAWILPQMILLMFTPSIVPLAMSTAKPVREIWKIVKNARPLRATMHSTAHGRPGNFSPRA
jgi:hypothetical protein